MAFPGQNYAPPGVYTQTFFENPVAGALETLKIPVFIGEGNESLFQSNLEVVRGSSSSIDQRRVDEDETGRAVVSVLASGQITLGNFDGVIDKFRVRNYPIVTGNGTGTISNNRADVSVTIDNQPIVIRSVVGSTGVVQLAQPPKAGQEVRCTYFFKRTDTLTTDDVSDQVDPNPANVRAVSGIMDVDSAGSIGAGAAVINLHGDILNGQGQVTTPGNNILLLTVDGVDAQIVIPPRANYTVAQVAAAITAARVETLIASRFTNNFGESALLLTADHSLVIGNGSANASLGLNAGQAATRVVTFYVFQGPIVDGSNGGVTTTDPAHVTVKVDGVQIIPTKVDGANRAVTLPVAPKAGAKVGITYYFNAWQDTFDYLANINVTQVLQCGDSPGSTSYIQGADFILQDDKILWGTAVATRAGVTSMGSTLFNDAQITTSLIDNKTFMSPCSTVFNVSGGISVASTTQFELPMQPTLGNGRDTPLGQSLFQTISNGRIDLPVDRPDVIDAYWGFDLQEALERGKVKVIKVDGLVITLAEPVPVGATVYASFWYNRLTDNEYTLTNVLAGSSGTGTYTVTDNGGNSVYVPTFDNGTKSAALNGVVVEFPSGSELTPDLRFEPVDDSFYKGPVEEIVTVSFGSKVATPAKYTVPGGEPYEFIHDYSDYLRIQVHGSEVTTAAGLHLFTPSAAHAGGFFASLVSDEVIYTGGTGSLAGQAYDITAPEQLTLGIDDADVMVKTSNSKTNQTIGFFATAINEAASGHKSTVGATLVPNTQVQLNVANYSNEDNYYVGWKVVIGNGAVVKGQARTITAYDGSGSGPGAGIATVSPAWIGGVPNIGDNYYIYNPAARSSMKGATKFNAPVVIAAGKHDTLKWTYIGTTGVIPPPVELTLTPGTYATPAALAAEVQAQIDALLIPGWFAVHTTFYGFNLECVANAEGQLEFRLQLPGADSAGFLQFLNSTGSPAQDFAVLAGLDTAAAAGGGQAALAQAPVAFTYQVPASGAFKPYDRLMLRNRLLPGGGASSSMAAWDVVSQTNLEVMSGNNKAAIGTGYSGVANRSAVVQPATLMGRVGFAGGMSGNAEPLVTFYDGTGTVPANNTFSFVMDGTPVIATFGASTNGTATELGPITTAGSVLGQIVAWMAAVPGAPFGAAPAIIAAKLVRQEGAGIRLTGSSVHLSSQVVINDASANGVLGFVAGQTALRTLVTAKQLASALMASKNSSFNTWVLDPTSTDAPDKFAKLAFATVETDGTGRDFLYVQDAPTSVVDLGPGSSITFRNTFNSVKNALAPVTGLNLVDGDGATGEAALNGFYVISNNPAGSGSANDSVLNNNVGQDGIIGQTYRDKVTGLTFTILPRGWQDNPYGPWIPYPTANANFRFKASKTFVTNANIPNNALNGIEMIVSNTIGIGVGDSALVNTYERGGQEPKVGDVYYTTYVYLKRDYTTAFFTKMSSIEQAYGVISPDNPVSLAAYLAILNGAMLVGIKQVPRSGSDGFASLTAYRDAIDELQGTLPGQIQPDMIEPLRGDSTDLYQYLKKSNEIMSSIRYRSERTSILGVSAGTLPQAVITMANTLKQTRMRLVYPDMVVVSLTDALGNIQDSLIDGPYLAAGLTGSIVSPNVDVATPWTGRRLVGYTQLGRQLDAVEQNQIAVNGVTILEDKPPFIRVRHGLTTDMTNTLTKLPTIVLIADEVQRQARATLESFIGIKFLPGILSQIEGRLAMMLKNLVAAAIISAYTGVKALVAPDDPTVANVEAYYSPIFPLLYIVLTFHLRASL